MSGFPRTLLTSVPRGWPLTSCVRPSVHPSVCPSASLSITRRYCIKTAKYRITQATPHDSQGFKFSYVKDLGEIRTGSPPTGTPNAGG